MTFTLYTNNSPKNKIGKTLVPLVQLTGTLKEDTSIINPVFTISDLTFALINQANYLATQDFGRSYFITEVVNLRNNLWEIHCHVDVLESFKVDIKNQEAVILRQENKWNLYLDDGIFKTYQNPLITTHNFPKGFANPSYILAVAGG